MNDVMLDLETIGTEANSVITSINAVEFDIETGQIREEFKQSITIKSCVDAGLKLDHKTFIWWLGQPEASRMKLIEDNDLAKPLKTVLKNFAVWLANLNQVHRRDYRTYNDTVRVWGRGPRFDCGLLSSAYEAIREDRTPWDFRNERCVRTMEMLAPDIKKNTLFTGILHEGLSDSKHQIKYVSSIYQNIKNKS